MLVRAIPEPKIPLNYEGCCFCVYQLLSISWTWIPTGWILANFSDWNRTDDCHDHHKWEYCTTVLIFVLQTKPQLLEYPSDTSFGSTYWTS